MNLLSRLRQIVMVSGVESFGVGVSGITGLLIVNVVPKEQYAVYTFLITCLQLIMGITDLGLSKCPLPIVGQRSTEVPWVMGVCLQIFRRRTLMLGLSFAVVIPYGIYTFIQHDWLAWAYFWAALLVVGSVLASLRAGLAGTVLVILGQVNAITRISFLVTTTRLILVGCVLLLPMTSYSIAFLLMATVISEFFAIVLFRREFKARKIEETRLSPEDEKIVDGKILKIVVPLIPSAIFFQVQGTITVFLASIFGTASTVAEIGAFGRLALALAIVDRVAGILLFPVVARAPAGKRLVSMISKVHVTYLCVMFLLLLTAIFFPQYWILLLGAKYENMVPYVWMLFLSSILMSGASFAFMTLAVRGFTEKQAYSVIFVILLQCAFLWKFGASTLPTILWFNIVTCSAHFVYQYALLFFKWSDLKREPEPDLECSTP
jgi:O-antigen/teichoic acid export membrane protein